MQFIEDKSGHVHTPRYTIPEGCTVAKCQHCGHFIRPNASNVWQPVRLEPSDFRRRKDAGDYLVYHPDRQEDHHDHNWLACVWNFSGKGKTPSWRHDNLSMYHPGFRTMREAIADRCAA